ncbi:MAG: hypothetical protein ABIY55_08180 [Kofleriaceae bacterium]
MVSSLDLECYRTPGPALDKAVKLTQLNTVLLQLGLPPQVVTVRELAQTCVPVQKDTSAPSATARAVVEQIDFACYRIDAAPLPNPINLNLTHLNPLLVAKGLPQHKVKLTQGVQLCLPVAKNNKPPTGDVLQLVRFLDLECFATEPGQHPLFQTLLTQLNPQLTGIPPHEMFLGPTPRQMCVPVQKNNQNIPLAISNIVQWVDLEKFVAAPPVTIAPVPVTLSHLNPLFAGGPQIQVVLDTAVSLMVPVAKNNHAPPND